jgi:membrane associated rhomboid family serine protease
MFLPIRSKNPPESLPIATICLILINLVVYLATTVYFLEIKEPVADTWGLKPKNFDFIHMNTSMFLHGNLFHLLGNMWFLGLFGFAVEGRLKPIKFLILYFAAGYAGDLLDLAVMGATHADMPSIGASGAIMGVLGGALYMFPHGKIDVLYYFGLLWHGIWEAPMWGIACIYLGLDLLEGMLFAGADGVGHFAHIGGAAGGVLVCLIFRPKRDDQFVSESKAILAETKDLKVLSRRELENLHKTNPDDDAVILNWVHKSLNEPGGPSAECKEAFFKYLPRMLQNNDIGPIAQCIGFLNIPAGSVSSKIVLDCGARLERAHDNRTALRMYEAILKDPNANAGDVESALFRGGLLSEAVFQRYDSAQNAYRELIRRAPMSPFADQARARLAYVESKLAPQQT